MNNEKNIHSGHRKRIRLKMKNTDSDSIEPHEFLEFLLFNVMAQKNTNVIAHKLLNRFNNSIADVLSAPVEELVKTDGIGEQAALFIHTLPILADLYTRSVHLCRTRLTQSNLAEYCLKLAGKGEQSETECVFIVLLNSNCETMSVINAGNECISENSLIDLRKILMYILNSDAAAVLLIHRCICTGSTVNNNIITNMKSLSLQLRAVNMPLIDYVIIHNNDFISLRELQNH